MALTDTDLSRDSIKAALGSSSNILRELCTDSNINGLGVSIKPLRERLSSWVLETRRGSQRKTLVATAPYRQNDFRLYNHSQGVTGFSYYMYPSLTSQYNWAAPAVSREGGTFEVWIENSITALKLIAVESWLHYASASRDYYVDTFGNYHIREKLIFSIDEWDPAPLNSEREGTLKVWTDEGTGDVQVKTIRVTQKSESSNYSMSLAVNGEDHPTAGVAVPFTGGSFIVDVTFTEPGIDWEYKCTADGQGLSNYTVGEVHEIEAPSPTTNNDGSFSILISENPSPLAAVLSFEVKTSDGFYVRTLNFFVAKNPTA